MDRTTGFDTASNDTAGAGPADRLVAAATIAALAPSIHNTQPWSWHIHDGVADLFADTRRQLTVIDPDRRLLTISCGSALHHARVALAADGLAVSVSLLPTADDPLHLARLSITGHRSATDAEARRLEMIRIRHTDRRPTADEAINDGDFRALRRIAAEYATGLHPLNRDDMIDLAAVTARAQRDEVRDIASRHELEAWIGDRRPAGAGIPDANVLDRPSQTTVPSRDFGHRGSLVGDDRHDNSATYAILYGLHDDPGSWIRAGEALSAMWLYAVEHNLALLPISAPVEEPFTWRRLHRILAGLGSACLAVRLGIADPDQKVEPRTPRLPISVTVRVTM